VKSKNEIGKGGNRHNLDIVRDILTVASVKARKTRIMYQANLSFVQVEKYLHALLEKGLLNNDADSSYLITKRGHDFLHMYEDYVERRRVIEEQVDQSSKERQLLELMCSSQKPYRAGKTCRGSRF